MPDLILFLVAITLIIALITFNTLLYRRYKNILMSYAKAIMDIDVLQNELKIANHIYSNDEFIKFMSESRESAFKYIEEIQEALKDFVEKADHIIRDSDVSPNTVLSYKRLIDMLPKENKDA